MEFSSFVFCFHTSLHNDIFQYFDTKASLAPLAKDFELEDSNDVKAESGEDLTHQSGETRGLCDTIDETEGVAGKSGCEEGPGVCALLMTVVSLLLILISLPVSLVFVVKVVQVRTSPSKPDSISFDSS